MTEFTKEDMDAIVAAAPTMEEFIAAMGATVVPSSNTPNSMFDCLNLARAQAAGKWTYVASTGLLTLCSSDGVTVVATLLVDPKPPRSFTRTPQ